MNYRIEQDEVNATGRLAGCETIGDVKKRLDELFPGDAWWVYEGGKHVRLHKYARRGLLARILGKGKPCSVFFATEI